MIINGNFSGSPTWLSAFYCFHHLLVFSVVGMQKKGNTKLSDKGTAWVVGQIVLLAGIVIVPFLSSNLLVLPDLLHGLSLIAGLLIGAAGLAIVGLSPLYL